MRTARVPALLLALALTAAACGDDESDSPPDVSAEAPETTDDAEADEPDDDLEADDPADEPEEAPDAEPADDGQVRGGGLELTAPEGWIVLDDASQFDDATREAAADALGIPPEELDTQLQQVEALALTPEPGDFADNLNIVIVPGETGLPDEDVLQADYEQIGAEVTAYEETDTPIGDGVLAEYVLDMGAMVQGAALFVEVDGQLVSVTVSTGEEGAARAILEEIADTLITTD